MKLISRKSLFLLLLTACVTLFATTTFGDFLRQGLSENAVQKIYGAPQISVPYTDTKTGERLKFYWYGPLPKNPSLERQMLNATALELAGIFVLPHGVPFIEELSREKARALIGGNSKTALIKHLEKNYLMMLHFNSRNELVSGIWPGKEQGLEPPVWNSTLTAEENRARKGKVVTKSENRLLQEENSNRKANGTSTLVQEELTVTIKEPKHVYVDSSQTCHKPNCTQIRGIEKRTLQRFESLEQALLAENKKCDSCMATE